MLKFFRKYNKIILVVGGSILMVLFLLPAGMSRMLGGGGLTSAAARVGGRTVTLGEYNDTGRRLQFVNAIAPELLQLTGVESNNSEHWLLLTEAARRSGLVGGPSDGEGFIPQMAETAVEWTIFLLTQQNPESATRLRAQRDQAVQRQAEYMQSVRSQAIEGGSAEFVDTTLAQARGVLRLLELNNTASLFSTRAAISLAKRLGDSASVTFASIPAGGLTASMELSEEELQEHFEKYKAVDAATDPYGIGYLQPDQVGIEWLTIDRIAIESRLPLDPIEVNKFWRQNRTRFPNDFEASRVAVETAFRTERANTVFDRLNDLIRRKLHASTASLGTGRYKDLPEDWASRGPTFEEIASELETRIAAEFNLGAGLRVLNVGGPLERQSVDQLRSLASIGQSSLRINDNSAIPFADYVMSVRELAGENRFNVQQGLVYGPLVNAGRSQFYFRINSVRPSGPPDSLAEVRTRVIPDLRILRGMQMLEEQADEYRARAISQGIASLADVPGAGYVTSVLVTRQTVRHETTQETFSMLNVPEFRDAVMDAAEKLDPTRPATELPVEERVVATTVPSAKSLVVVEIQRFRPLTAERFREISVPVRYLANTIETAGDPFDAYTFESLAARLDFQRLSRADDDEEAEAEAESGTGAGAEESADESADAGS